MSETPNSMPLTAPELVRVQTRSVPREDRFEYWRSVFPGVDIEPSSARQARESFAGSVLALNDPAGGGTICCTTSDPNIAAFNDDSRENVLIGAVTEGRIQTSPVKKGDARILPPGTLYMMDLVNTRDFRVGRFRNIFLSMPRNEAFKLMGASAAPGNGLRLLPDSALGRIFWSHLTSTLREADALPRSQAASVILTAKVLAASLLGQAGDAGSAQTQLDDSEIVAAARRCMTSVMHVSDFDAGKLARMMGQSRSRLYRAFQTQGLSVSRQLATLRMERAAALLISSRAQIGDIALECGYADFSAFSRAFRRHHGLSPKDYRFQTAPRGDGGH